MTWITLPPRNQYQTRKIGEEQLKAFVKEHPDWTLKEYAQQFGCAYPSIADWLEKFNITRKKITSTKRGMSKKEPPISSNSTK